MRTKLPRRLCLGISDRNLIIGERALTDSCAFCRAAYRCLMIHLGRKVYETVKKWNNSPNFMCLVCLWDWSANPIRLSSPIYPGFATFMGLDDAAK